MYVLIYNDMIMGQGSQTSDDLMEATGKQETLLAVQQETLLAARATNVALFLVKKFLFLALKLLCRLQ